MLMPKSTLLLRHLNTDDQIENWITVYQQMQKNMIYGQLIGVGIYVGLALIRP